MSIYTQFYQFCTDWRIIPIFIIVRIMVHKRAIRNSKYWEGVYKRNEQEKKRDEFFKKLHKKR